MQLTNYQPLLSAMASAEQACKLVEEIGQKELAEDLRTTIEKIKENRFFIGVVGSAKRGKSTLINGLLGRSDDKCAPIGSFPATNVISIFGSTPTPETKVLFHNGGSQIITETEICQYVTEDKNRDNAKGVRSLEVLAPFPGLESGVYLVDTPGADNALTAAHGEILYSFLPIADAIIFLVTADSPLTESESRILREIKRNDTKKLFFAVNKVDRLEDGDLTTDELAEGIAHNRKILANAGFSDAKIYEISAKKFHKERSDAGTDALLADIRKMIAAERLQVMTEKLASRTAQVLEKAKAEATQALQLAKTTKDDLETERKELEKLRKELGRNQSKRKRDFSGEWDAAFDNLETTLRQIRKELKEEYSAVVENAGIAKVSSLQKTIHADVAASFAERMLAPMQSCENQINDAQRQLAQSVQSVFLSIHPEAQPLIGPKGNLLNAVQPGLAALPAGILGGAILALPGAVGALIAGAIPAVATITLNPFTWLPALASGGGAAVVTGVQATVVSALTAIASPVAIGVFAFAAYRVASTWKANQEMQKNELKSKVLALVDTCCEQIQPEIQTYRKLSNKIVEDFEESIEIKMQEAEDRIVELLANRPSPQEIQMLEDRQCKIEKTALRLVAETAPDAPRNSALTPSLTETVGNHKS